MNSIKDKLNKILKEDNFSPEEKKFATSFFKRLKEYHKILDTFRTEIGDNGSINKLSEKKFSTYQREIISQAYYFEQKVKSNILKKKIRELFRDAVGEYIFQSSIIRRSYEKPRGYPGDYFVFEMFYSHNLATKGIGYYLDNWVLKYELVRGAIYRKNKIKKLLGELINSNSKKKLDILNIGCGSSREIRELISERRVNLDNVVFTCLDQDDEALSFSKKAIREIAPDINISLVEENILSIVGLSKTRKPLSKQDIVYSIGVADYFLKTTLENFIRFCYNLLKPKGKLIIPLCSSHNPKLYVPLRWFCEWHFYSHKTDDIKNFIQNELHIKRVKIIWEKRNPIFFVVIEK